MASFRNIIEESQIFLRVKRDTKIMIIANKTSKYFIFEEIWEDLNIFIYYEFI